VARSIVSPADQRVTWVELFFDLVFVFSVTKVVALVHHHLSWLVVGEAVLVFWLVWWAWTQFTWALNAADTTHPAVQLGTLAATAVAFFMVGSLPKAFAEQAVWFAVPYVLVRLIGLGLYAWVAASNLTQRSAVRIFTAVSLSGLVAVLVGATLGGTAQLVWWSAAIVLDMAAAGVGGRLEGWNLHPEHFSERHGLFVIIALGESLVLAASGLSDARWTGALLTIALLAVATAGAWWWTYFCRARQWLEHGLASSEGRAQSRLARDAFSLLHFPLLGGLVAYAVAIEDILAHPGSPLTTGVRALLALGVLLYSGCTALAVRRAGYRLLWPRLAFAVLGATAIMGVPHPSPELGLAIVFLALAATATVEQSLGQSVAPSVRRYVGTRGDLAT
jgi:low temperature requirement protein LtrA